jgi:hypothetical protein
VASRALTPRAASVASTVNSEIFFVPAVVTTRMSPASLRRSRSVKAAQIALNIMSIA